MAYSGVPEALYGPAKRTKKAPRPVLYDPISHSEREYLYADGKVVPSPRSPANTFLQQASFSSPSLPVLRPRVQANAPWLHSLSPSSSFPKTQVRSHIFNPITGIPASFQSHARALDSLGNPTRWVAPAKHGNNRLPDGRKAQVAYVSPFLI